MNSPSLYRTLLYSTAPVHGELEGDLPWEEVVLYYTVLYYNVLYCTILFCTAPVHGELQGDLPREEVVVKCSVLICAHYLFTGRTYIFKFSMGKKNPFGKNVICCGGIIGCSLSSCISNIYWNKCFTIE